MQFQVPQFLEIEDKIFGPFTFRQFIYMIGGLGLCYVFYRLLGFFWGFIPIALIAGFAGALAFYRPNNKPFINMVESAFHYFFQDKLYIWRKEAKNKDGVRERALPVANKAEATLAAAKLSGGKLRDLAWSLDVLDLSKQKQK